MVISSRTPEGRPNHCPVCGSDLKIEPSTRPETPRARDAAICSGSHGKTSEMSRSSDRRVAGSIRIVGQAD